MVAESLSLSVRDFVGIGITILLSGTPLVLLVGYRLGRWTHALDAVRERLEILSASVDKLNTDRERTGERLRALDNKLAVVADRVGVSVH